MLHPSSTKERAGAVVEWRALTMTFAVATALQLDLIHPMDHVSTGRDQIVLVGRTTAENVSIRLNGELVATPSVKDAVFHARVFLPYGLNTVTAMVSDDEANIVSETIEALRGPRVKTQVAKMYLDHRFHDDNPRSECLSCHAREHAPLSTEADVEWCASCHSGIAARVKAHAPDDDRGCTNCHVFDLDLTLAEQHTFEQKNRCYGCHSNKIGEFAREYIHGPVAGGACIICHDPHGSRFEPNLVAPVAILCLSCHTDSIDDEAPVQHQPFEIGQCTACHDPHATNNRWVLVRSSRKLCLECHGDPNGEFNDHGHPFDVKPRTPVYGLRLAENGELECLTCHSPHATEAQHLLRTDERFSCAGCHPEHR